MNKQEEKDHLMRARVVEALRWLGEIDTGSLEERYAGFDEATFSLEGIMSEGGADRALGLFLRNEAEVRALNGVRASLLCLHQALGDGPLNEEFLEHPFLLGVACAANWASAVLEADAI